jgi:hypothetical protein
MSTATESHTRVIEVLRDIEKLAFQLRSQIAAAHYYPVEGRVMPSRPTTTREVLVEARKLIENPEDWVGDGEGWGPGRNCAITALMEVSPPGKLQGGLELYMACGRCSIVSFNDTHSHAEVLDLFDRAIGSLPLDREAAG